MNSTKTLKTTSILLTILLVTTFPTTHATRPDPDVPGQGNGIFGIPGFKLPEFGKGLGSDSMGSGGLGVGSTGSGGLGAGSMGSGGVGSGSMGSGGFGFGFGGPNGGFSKGGVFGSSTVCQEQGPCYMKKLTCPSQCFKSFSNSGNSFGFGGGGGGCNFDCKSACTATC